MNISRICFYNLIMVILLAVFLGKYMLNDVLGIPYYHEGGNPVFKIHIYSYLLMISSVYVSLKYGFKNTIIMILNGRTYWLVYFVVVSVVAITGVLLHGTGGMAYVIDTIMAPALALFLAYFTSFEQKKSLLKILLVCLLINSCVALLEFIFHKNLLPRLQPVWEFRSWAFLSHPLNNALITAGLMFLLTFNLKLIPKAMFISLFLLALLAYGGRAAYFLVLLVFTYLVFKQLTNFVFFRYRLKMQNFLFIHFYFLIAIFMFLVALKVGLGDRIFYGLEVDGSAQTRFDVFNLFNYISFKELLWGADQNFFSMVESIVGVETIENPWLGWIFQFGLISMIPMTLSLIYLLYKITHGVRYIQVITLMFVVICSANNSLSTKTPALMLFVLTAYISIIYFSNNHKSTRLIS